MDFPTVIQSIIDKSQLGVCNEMGSVFHSMDGRLVDRIGQPHVLTKQEVLGE